MSHTTTEAPETRKPRGFQCISLERRREISSMGGKCAHQLGVAHEYTSEEARSAGRKGGTISRGGRGRLKNEEVARGE